MKHHLSDCPLLSEKRTSDNFRSYNILTVSLVISSCLSILLGQDSGWDLRNYHLYTSASIIGHFFDRDFFVANYQSTFKPTLDILDTYLTLGPLTHYPRVLACFMGLEYGLLIFITYLTVEEFLEPSPHKSHILSKILMTSVAVSGAAALPLVGSSTHDIMTASIVLSGLLLALKFFNTWESDIKFTRIFLAALMMGLATGLKLTNFPYLVAFLIMVVVRCRGSHFLYTMLSTVVGCSIGFLISYGWWGIFLYKRFDSPFFPYLNNIFHSPLAPDYFLSDTRFLPQDGWELLYYPFTWMFNSELHRINELPFRDPRLAIGYICLALIISLRIGSTCSAACRRLNMKLKWRESDDALLLFYGTSLLFWLHWFAILRYAIPIEVLSVIFFAIILLKICEPISHQKLRSLKDTTLLILVSITIFIKYPAYPRVGFGERSLYADTSWVKDHSLILTNGPVGFIIPLIPKSLHIRAAGFGVITYGAKGFYLGEHIKDLIRSQDGPIYILYTNDRRSMTDDLLPKLGLVENLATCRLIETNLTPDFRSVVHSCLANKIDINQP